MSLRFISVLAALSALALTACPDPETPEGCDPGEVECGDSCVDLLADANNCGACGNACTGGDVCDNGTCASECAAPTTACSGACVNLDDDPDNCGACGTECDHTEVCADGECTFECPGDLAECGGSCVATDVDPDNCGGCGTECADGEVCADGTCTFECPGDLTDCDGSCIDTDNDPDNCGDCDTECGAGEFCVDGVCTFSCPGDLAECDGSCVDTDNDPDNCGACGTECGAGEFCVDGECGFSCPGSLTDCDGSCVNTNIDPSNCGGCATACADGEVCADGACTFECPGSLTNCDGSCINTNVDPGNCGGCGTECAGGEVCDAGSCRLVCGGGTTECDSACVNLRTDPDNCGTCGTECAEGEVCSSGECGLFCSGGSVECDGACVNLGNDPRNCGACGTACDPGEVCSDGSCDLFCVGGTTECDGACVSLGSDPHNCGACGTICDVGDACFSGECSSRPLDDTDADTISDYDEDSATEIDTDGDGRPDYRDLDSDGDGLNDEREAGDGRLETPPIDSDRDGTPDFRDLDSDNDSIPDADEAGHDTSTTEWDTDGDGESDGVEVAGGSDPTNPDDTVESRGGFTFDLLPGGVDRTDTLTFEPSIQRADILFLVDTTGSMGGEINNLQSSLAAVTREVGETIPDTAFGVARFDDFPTAAYGSTPCNGESDYPFQLEQRVTTDADDVRAGVDALDAPLHCGFDGPESQIEALYQAATGEGFRAPSGVSWVEPFDPDAGFDPDLGHGRIGGAGFREDSLPIIIMATDATFHRHWGDTRVNPADPATWCGNVAGDGCDAYDTRYFGGGADQQPKSWAASLEALNDIAAAVIGVASEGAAGSDWRTELSAFAVRTGTWIEPTGGRCPTGLAGAMRPADTYDPDGAGPLESQAVCPLVYSIQSNGTGLADSITDAISDLVSFVSFDTLHTEARDNPDTEIDETRFFVRGIPVSADPATCRPMPIPGDRLPEGHPDGTFDSFTSVVPGCLTTFQIVARNDGFVERACVDQIFNLDIVVIGDDVVEADRRTVVVRVPGNPSLCD